ncbi:hypothetical protein ACOMHN_034293 [Nucella lapillus]
MIEDSPGPQHTGHLGPGSSGIGMVTKQQQDDVGQRPQYSMPGILHFLQTEWARFEMERSQWEVERAELQARIAFLQGERKGQENLKQDLVRRIKMLEFALKQERGKYHKLKYGTDMNSEDLTPPTFDKKDDDQVDAEPGLSSPTTSNAQWKQGRQLLRQYLQEIGYTDTIIDVRSARVRSLLGLQPVSSEMDMDGQPALTNGEQQPIKRDSSGKRVGLRRLPGIGPMDSALMDTENSIMNTFDFLAGDSDMTDSKETLGDDSEDGITADDEADERLERKGVKIKVVGNDRMGADDLMEDPETEEAMAEFDFLVTESDKKEASSNAEWRVDQRHISELKEQYRKERKEKHRPSRSALQAMLANLESDDEMSSPGSPNSPGTEEMDTGNGRLSLSTLL